MHEALTSGTHGRGTEKQVDLIEPLCCISREVCTTIHCVATPATSSSSPGPISTFDGSPGLNCQSTAVLVVGNQRVIPFILWTLFDFIYQCLFSTLFHIFGHNDAIIYPRVPFFFPQFSFRRLRFVSLHHRSFLFHSSIHVPSSRARLAIIPFIQFSFRRLSSRTTTTLKLLYSKPLLPTSILHS